MLVTDKMRKAGEKIAANIFDAHVDSALSNSSCIQEMENNDLVGQCIDGKISSVVAIYLAMERVK